ncbi:MAG TPA: STAS domain-containing protein [Gemmatimonadaceae bacterium]
MMVPILKRGDCLIASIPSPLSDSHLLRLRDNLAAEVGRARSRTVFVDVSLLDVMDSFAVRTLSSLAHMNTARGAETVIVGIRPDVALAMAQLGLTLHGMSTAHDLEQGLTRLGERLRRSSRAGH